MKFQIYPYIVAAIAVAVVGVYSADVGDFCASDGDCSVQNSECVYPYETCVYGVCTCQQGFYNNETFECRQIRQLSEPCDYDEDCDAGVAYSICNEDDSQCRCPEGDHVAPYEDEETGKFYCYTSRMNEACDVNAALSDCLSWRINGNGACVLGFCVCKLNYTQYGEKCLEVKHQDHCPQEYLFCESNLHCQNNYGARECLCPAITRWDYFTDTCVSIAEEVVVDQPVGEECTMNPEGDEAMLCKRGLICDHCPNEDVDDTVCQLPYVSVDIDNVCHSGSDCGLDHSYCHKPYAECNSGTCLCESGYYFSSDSTCRKASDIGEACETTEDCLHTVAYSRCNEYGFCQCPYHTKIHEMHDGRRVCYVAAAGELCGEADEKGDVDYDECLAYRLNPNGALCGPESEDETDDVCHCAPQYTLLDQECLPVFHMDSCELFEDLDKTCIESTVCASDGEIDICQCPHSTIWTNIYGLCVHEDAVIMLGEGEDCNNNYDMGSGRLCHPALTCGVCAGGTGGSTCLKPAGNIGDFCQTDSDCLAENSSCHVPYEDCTHGACQCNALYFVTSQPGKFIGDACDNDHECHQGTVYSVCDRGVCACRDDEDTYAYQGKNYCYLKSAGEPCRDSIDCLSYRINMNGECVLTDGGQVCLCRPEYNMVDQVCLPADFGQNCVTINNVVKQCEDNSLCYTEDVDPHCRCHVTEKWDALESTCVNINAEKEKRLGEACDESTDLCMVGLECGLCPGQPRGTEVCQRDVGAPLPTTFEPTEPDIVTTEKRSTTTESATTKAPVTDHHSLPTAVTDQPPPTSVGNL